MGAPAKKTAAKRPARPAAERAQEALDTANRVLATAETRLAAAEERVVELKAEVVQLGKHRDYAALNPALPEQETVADVIDTDPPAPEA